MIETTGYEALRSQCAGIDTDRQLTIWRFDGAEAVDTLDEVLPGKVLFLQPDAALPTAVVDDQGELLDVGFLLNRGDHYLLVSSQSEKESVGRFLANHLKPGVTFRNVDGELASYQVEGPFSWKLVKTLAGPDLVGLPYLGFMEFSRDELSGLVLRVKLTGEYGFLIVVDRGDLRALKTVLNEHAGGLAELGDPELKLAAREARVPLTGATILPGASLAEASLRFMVDFTKHEFIHRRALLARLERETHETVGFVGPASGHAKQPVEGQEILLDGDVVGTVLTADASPTLRRVFGYARIRRDLACPGLDALYVRVDGTEVRLETVSTPFFATKSTAVTME